VESSVHRNVRLIDALDSGPVKIRRLCLGLLALLPALHAQHALIVNEYGTPQVVRAVRYQAPQIGEGDNLRSGRGQPYALSKAAIYRPGFLALRNMQVRTWHLEVVGSTARLNYELEIRADVTSDTDLKNCFLVLDIQSGKDKGIIYLEMPDLRSGQQEQLNYRFPVVEDLEAGRYRIYFFSDGPELLTSQMPPAYVEAQKRKTEEFLLHDQADRTVEVLRVVPPTYPPALLPGGSAGSAVIRCRIDASGKLIEATVARASDPAFGEAALAAVRQWQFGPAVKDHHYVATTVEVPFDFPAPAAAAK
jgi:TonB family protein